MWEYNRVVIQFKTVQELLNKLNILGADNWEIISYEETKSKKFDKKTETIILMKKQKPCTKEKQ